MTPIARLTGEYEVIVVPASVAVSHAGRLIRALKARPESISWGGGSAGGSDQILAGLVADAVGVPPRRVNYIAFSGGGESLSAILGGQVSVGINGLAEFAPQIEAGTCGRWRSRAPNGCRASTCRRCASRASTSSSRTGARWSLRRASPRPSARGSSGRSRRWSGRRHGARRWRATAGSIAICRASDSRGSSMRKRRACGRSCRSSATGQAQRPARWRPSGRIRWFVLAGLAGLRPRCARVGRARAVPRSAPSPRRREIGRHGRCWIGARRWSSTSLLAETGGFVIASAVLFWLTARAFDHRHPCATCAFAVGRVGGRVRAVRSRAAACRCRPACWRAGCDCRATRCELLRGGFASALTLAHLAWALAGVTLGTAVGVLPGIGPALTVAVLLPVTFNLDPISAFIMFGGIYYGAMYGGSTTSILLNTPGETGIDCDGDRRVRHGAAGPRRRGADDGGDRVVRRRHAGDLALTFFAPPLAAVALRFGPAEYFALAVRGVHRGVALLGGSLCARAASACFSGLALGLVGIDQLTGDARFSFGIPQLLDGIDVVILVIGLFAVGETLYQAWRYGRERARGRSCCTTSPA